MSSEALPRRGRGGMLPKRSAAAADSESRTRTVRILVPTDFSACAKRALAEAMELGRDGHARVTLLYVVDLNLHTPPTAPVDCDKLKAELRKEVADQLGQAIMELARHNVEAETVIREGLPCEQIIEAAHGHDLIVIGRRKPKSIWRLFSRQTVKGVLDGAPCPVVVVPEKNQNAQEKT